MIRVYFIRKDTVAKTGDRDTVLGRLLLRYGLRKDYGITDIDVTVGDRGKPYLASHQNIHFSISHTLDAVAVAISENPVGLDVETVTDKMFLRIIKDMFTEKEREYAEGDPERFFEIWTRKESYVKLTGEGINRRMGEFDVLSGENTGGAVFTPVHIPNTAACVCSFAAESVEIHELFTEELEGVKNDCI